MAELSTENEKGLDSVLRAPSASCTGNPPPWQPLSSNSETGRQCPVQPP